MSDTAMLPMQSMTFPYQFMSSMSAEAFESLKADIAFRGVIVPVLYDSEGRILDGHHRVRACEELGITDFPRLIQPGLNEADKEDFVYAVNLFRRHDPDAQTAFILKKRSDGRSLRQIADMAGVSEFTVRNRIKDSTALNIAVAFPETIVGKDGKERAASRPKPVYAATEKEAERTFDLLSGLDEDRINSLPATATASAVRKVARAQDRDEIAAMIEPSLPSDAPVEVAPGEWWRLGNHLLFCGDSASSAFIDNAPACPFAFADPPYNVGKADWDDAFKWRHDWLSDSAEVVAITPGISEFQRFFSSVRMPYKWTFTAWIKNGMTRGEMGFGNTLLALLFSHGSIHRAEQDFMPLVVETSTTGDTLHPSRKPLPFVARLMQIYTAEGDSVIDPFLGSGTTLWAAEEMGRRAYTAEISPSYCGEIIGRWQAMTGEIAVKQ